MSAQTPAPQRGARDSARERLLEVERVLNSVIIGHEEMTKALLVGLVAREHVVLIGAPGTAKSFMVHSLAKLLSARFYRYLLTKFTDYSELFGPIDIQKLADGAYQRKWSAIVEADIVFLDEIFKANSAILNALLSMLQERVVYDGMTGEAREVALWTAVGASNEVPTEEELQALYDRFAIRVFVDYLSDDIAILRALEARWVYPVNGFELKPIASMEDVKAIHMQSLALILAQVKQLGAPLYKIYHANIVPMVKTLRSRGVVVSDRTITEKLPKIYAAYLTLYGLTIDNIFNAPFDILKWMAKDKTQLAEIQKALDESMGEVAELARKLEEGKRLIKAHNYQAALKQFEEILTFDVSKLIDKPWLKVRAEAIISMARMYKQRLEEQLKLLEKLAEEMGNG